MTSDASLHPGAWIAWLSAVAIFAFTVTNPLYTVLALAAVIVVHLSLPSTDSVRAVRMFIVFGCVLLLLRLLFVALLPNPGTTILFFTPRLVLPNFLGALQIGGPVTQEVLVAGASEGLRLVLVLAAFGVFNAHADTSSLLRSVPSVFRDTGLVVSIAFAFVPGMIRTVRDVRDAQRLRGERGLRRLAPSLAVPVLGLSLERALLLAESMDARGYGVAASSALSRNTLIAGLVALLASVPALAAGLGTVATALAIAGAVAIVISLRLAASTSKTTRLTVTPVRATDLMVIVACAGIAVLAFRAGGDATYNPYPVFVAPGFTIRTAFISAALLIPAVAR